MESSLDKVMTKAAQTLNSHPDMNVRMRWIGAKHRHHTANDADYWLGVCYSAYQKQVFSKDEMKEILLALKASGAKSDYFKKIVKEILL